MDLARQFISYDQLVRNDTAQDEKDFNSQYLATQAKKGEQLVYMMPSFNESFDSIDSI